MSGEPGSERAPLAACEGVPVVGVEPLPKSFRGRTPPAPLAWLLVHQHLVALVVGLLLVVAFALVRVEPGAALRYGYAGVFLVTLVATGGLVLPVPYLLAVVAAGAVLNPLLVGLTAGFASALGELTGYLVGFAGAPVLHRSRWHVGIEHWIRRRGFWTVFVLAVVPNPLFDAAGIAAGSFGMPLWQFWVACFCGKTLRLSLIAWLASLVPISLEPWLG